MDRLRSGGRNERSASFGQLFELHKEANLVLVIDQPRSAQEWRKGSNRPRCNKVQYPEHFHSIIFRAAKRRRRENNDPCLDLLMFALDRCCQCYWEEGKFAYIPAVLQGQRTKEKTIPVLAYATRMAWNLVVPDLQRTPCLITSITTIEKITACGHSFWWLTFHYDGPGAVL